MASTPRAWNDVDVFDLLLLAAGAVGVFVCPFTKVEESFNTQAIHDLLLLGNDLKNYDHLDFPGVVPRTFIGAILVSALTAPALVVRNALGLPKLFLLYCARCVICSLSWMSFLAFRRGVSKAFGLRASQLTSFIAATTFHLPFYMSRPLPNTFALIGCLNAFGAWMAGHPLSDSGLKALLVIAPVAVVFRCDMLILAVPWTIQLLLCGRLPFFTAIIAGGFVVALSALASVLIDGYFWGRDALDTPTSPLPLWPEAHVLLFNTVDNRSSEWGVAPWHWYFTRALPKSLHVWLVAALAGFLGLRHPLYYIESAAAAQSLAPPAQQSSPITKSNSQDSLSGAEGNLQSGLVSMRFIEVMAAMFKPAPQQPSHSPSSQRRLLFFSAPALMFVALYSLLPHKELRFVLPVALPVLCMAAAVGLDSIIRPDSEGTVLHLLLFGSLATHAHPSYLPTTRTQGQRLWVVKYARRTSRNIFLFDLYLSELVIVMILWSWAVSSVFLSASYWNYPGGDALQHLLHQHLPVSLTALDSVHLPKRITVHIDTFAAMTGVSRFLHEDIVRVPVAQGWRDVSVFYSKEEGLRESEEGLTRLKTFDWLITDNPILEGYSVVREVHGFNKVVLQQPWTWIRLPRLLLRPRLAVRVETAPAVFVLQRSSCSNASETCAGVGNTELGQEEGNVEETNST